MLFYVYLSLAYSVDLRSLSEVEHRQHSPIHRSYHAHR